MTLFFLMSRTVEKLVHGDHLGLRGALAPLAFVFHQVLHLYEGKSIAIPDCGLAWEH